MAGSRAVRDSWGNAKWKEGQAAPASAKETTQLLKGQSEGLEWNELSCRIYHSDSEIRVRGCLEASDPGSSRFAAEEKKGKE